MIKTLPDLQIDDIIIVKWVDQNSYTEAHPAKGSLNECYGFTQGFYLEANKEWLCLGMEKMVVENVPDAYRHIVSLPICAILEVKKIGTLIKTGLTQ